MQGFKCRELQVGDWVQSHNGKMARITTVGEVYAYADFVDKYVAMEFNDFPRDNRPFGIPFTKDIAGMNGFYTKDNRYYVLKSNPRIGWDSKEHSLLIGYADSGIRLDYVHQMQHILRDINHSNTFTIK